MKNILPTWLSLLVVFFSTFFNAHAQLSLDWSLSQGSKISDLSSNCRMDSEAYLYVMCVFRDTLDLDPGPGEDIYIPPAPEALVISKFYSDGTYHSNNSFLSNGEIGGSISEIKNDELLLIIYFTDSLVFVHEGIPTTIVVDPGQNIHILKMDTEGQLLWDYDFQDVHNMYFSDLNTLEDGSYLAAGSFEGTFTLDVVGGSTSVISNGEEDGFIAHFDQNFKLQWITTMGGFGADYIEKIFLKDDKTIYFTMIHDSTVFLVTDEGINTYPAFGEDNNIYGIASFDGGSIQKAYSFGGALGDQLRSIVSDDQDNIYICGYFEGEVNFQNPPGAPVRHTSINGSDGFVAKYNDSGSLQWVRIFTDTDYGGLYTMNLERGNELYLTGTFTDKGDLNPGPDTMYVQATYDGSTYVVKFDTDGNMKWVHDFRGTGNGGIRTLILNDTSVILHGYNYDTIDFDPSGDEYFSVSHGGSDMFLTNFIEEGVISGTESLHPLEIVMYPNPVSDEIKINCDMPIDEIAVISMNGAIQSVPVRINGQTSTLNVRTLSSGIYLVKIKSGDMYSITKFVKE